MKHKFPKLIIAGVTAGLLAAASATGPTLAAGMGLHPVRGWHGNEFLFEVTRSGHRTHLTVYRALGTKWERIGATTLAKGQRRPQGGFLQKIWFKGRKLKSIRADMGNSWWRYWPGDDSRGGAYIN